MDLLTIESSEQKKVSLLKALKKVMQISDVSSMNGTDGSNSTSDGNDNSPPDITNKKEPVFTSSIEMPMDVSNHNKRRT